MIWEPTEPRIPVPRVGICPLAHMRDNKACAFTLDEQGTVMLAAAGQGVLRLRPEDAFDLLDFLFEHRNFLAALSAKQVER